MSDTLPRDHRVASYVPAEMADAIDRAANEEGLTRAAFIRSSLLKVLATREAIRRAADAAPALSEDQAAVLAASGLVYRRAS